MVDSAREVENAGVGLFAIVPTGLVRIFHFPSAEAPGYWQSSLRVFARSLAEKADYGILIQENT